MRRAYISALPMTKPFIKFMNPSIKLISMPTSYVRPLIVLPNFISLTSSTRQLTSTKSQSAEISRTMFNPRNSRFEIAKSRTISNSRNYRFEIAKVSTKETHINRFLSINDGCAIRSLDSKTVEQTHVLHLKNITSYSINKMPTFYNVKHLFLESLGKHFLSNYINQDYFPNVTKVFLNTNPFNFFAYYNFNLSVHCYVTEEWYNIYPNFGTRGDRSQITAEEFNERLERCEYYYHNKF